MSKRVDLAGATQEWYDGFRAKHRLMGSWNDTPQQRIKFYVGEQLDFGCDNVRCHTSEITLEASEITPSEMRMLLDAVLVFENKEFQLYHINSRGEQVNEYGNEFVEHRVELTFRPKS